MATATATRADADSRETAREAQAIKLPEAELLKPVDPHKVYRLTLQLGNGIRFRQFKPGKVIETGREPVPGSQRGEMRVTVQMIPSVHSAGPYLGETVNGLIAYHNRFLEANRGREGNAGKVSNMLLVSNLRETNEAATEAKEKGGLTTAQGQMITSIVGGTVRGLLPELVALIQEQSKPPEPPKPQGGRGKNSN